MSFRVHFSPSLTRKIAAWALPDFLVVEIHLRLRHELSARPLELLVRTQTPFDGMTYYFTLIEPSDRLTEHECLFHVFYG